MPRAVKDKKPVKLHHPHPVGWRAGRRKARRERAQKRKQQRLNSVNQQ